MSDQRPQARLVRGLSVKALCVSSVAAKARRQRRIWRGGKGVSDATNEESKNRAKIDNLPALPPAFFSSTCQSKKERRLSLDEFIKWRFTFRVFSFTRLFSFHL